MRETRVFRNVEVRAAEGTGPNGRPVVTLRAITPNMVDDYGSVWMADTFDEDVVGRMEADADDTPSLAWAHNWSDPIGHGIGYTPSDHGPEVSFELDDFDAVPRARQADAQVRSRTIRDCSVGFSNAQRRDPTDDEVKRYPGIREVIEKAYLDEVSLVMRGAVPGAKVLTLRSAHGGTRQVPFDVLEAVSAKVAAGEMSQEQAAVALDLAAGITSSAAGAPKPPSEPVADDGTVSEADALLEGMGL